MVHLPLTCRELLEQSLQSGRLIIGEIQLGRDFSFCHVDDVGRKDLEIFHSASDARELARYDGEGNFRPLKTAPTLRRGWHLKTSSLEEMERALDYFYPSSLGLWLSFLKGSLQPTNLRQTLDRQTGMYRVTQLLKPDQANDLVGKCCSSQSGCLRTILWNLDDGLPVTSLPSDKLSLSELSGNRIPLLCRELCNLVVAAARPIAKGNLPKKE